MAENLTVEERTKEGHRGRRKLKNRSEMSVEQPAANKPNGHPVTDESKQPKLNFFQRVAQMTQEDWDRHRLYVYRQWPRITRDGAPHYIAVHREGLDEEAIKRLYGSGRYSLRLNNEKRTIDQTSLEIMDLACPPKLSSDELVGAPENERFHKLWPSTTPKPPAEGANAGDAAAVKELVGLLKTLVVDRGKSETDEVKNTLINWALSQTSKEREANSPGALAELVNAIKSILPNPAPVAAPPTAPQVDILGILKQVRELQPDPPDMLAILEQARTLFAPQQPATNDDFARFEKFLNVADKLAGWRGGAGPRSAWDVGLEYGRELGLPIAQQIINLMALRTGGGAMPTMPVGAPARPAAPSAFDPYSNPMAAREHAARMAAQAAATQQPPPQGSPQPQPPFGAPPVSPGPPQPDAPAAAPMDELTVLMHSYGGIVLNALNTGLPGYEFAESVERLLGTATVLSIASFGEAAISRVMLTIPQLGLFGEGRLQQFANEFVNYEQFLSEAEKENGAAETEAGEEESPSHQRRASA